MGSVVVNGLYLWKGREMVCLRVKLGPLIRRRRKISNKSLTYIITHDMKTLLYSNTVLYQPFVDCFCRMRHKYPAFEIRLCQNIRKGGGMIKMEAKKDESVHCIFQSSVL